MNGNLILSSDRAVCTSTYPEYDYATVTITLPSAMTGATFESVAFTYSRSQTSGTYSVKFNDTRQDVSNARILERLQNGDTELVLLFSFRSSSGEKTMTWSNLQIAVTYQPAAKINGTLTAADGSKVFYAIDVGSIARGETIPVLLTITPVRECNAISFAMRGGTQSNAFTVEPELSLPAGRDTTITVNLSAPADYTMSSRVMAAAIKFVLWRTDNTYSESSWTTIGMNVVRERNAPVVSSTISDTSTAYSKVGAFVQGKSTLRITATITLDTEADPSVAVASRELTIGGVAVEMGGNSVDIETADLSGTITRTFKVTDTFGKSTTRQATFTVKPYAPPEILALQLERYTVVHPSSGGTERVPDDGSDLVSIKYLKYFTYWVNGRNAYTLTASWDGGSKVIEQGNDGAWYSESWDDWYSLSTVSFSPTREYLVTFTLEDSLGGTATATFTLPMAGGIFNIEKGGVAVGKRVTGTALEPKFECAYPATFEGGVFDGDGNRIGSVDYILPETRIGTFLGKALYRKGVQLDTYSSSSSTLTQVDFQVIPTRITKIEGFVMTNGYGDLPLNSYHSSSIRTFCRPDGLTGRLIGYSTNVNSGAIIFIEYTKD